MVKFASVQFDSSTGYVVREEMLKEVLAVQKWIEKLQITNPDTYTKRMTQFVVDGGLAEKFVR